MSTTSRKPKNKPRSTTEARPTEITDSTNEVDDQHPPTIQTSPTFEGSTTNPDQNLLDQPQPQKPARTKGKPKTPAITPAAEGSDEGSSVSRRPVNRREKKDNKSKENTQLADFIEISSQQSRSRTSSQLQGNSEESETEKESEAQQSQALETSSVQDEGEGSPTNIDTGTLGGDTDDPPAPIRLTRRNKRAHLDLLHQHQHSGDVRVPYRRGHTPLYVAYTSPNPSRRRQHGNKSPQRQQSGKIDRLLEQLSDTQVEELRQRLTSADNRSEAESVTSARSAQSRKTERSTTSSKRRDNQSEHSDAGSNISRRTDVFTREQMLETLQQQKTQWESQLQAALAAQTRDLAERFGMAQTQKVPAQPWANQHNFDATPIFQNTQPPTTTPIIQNLQLPQQTVRMPDVTGLPHNGSQHTGTESQHVHGARTATPTPVEEPLPEGMATNGSIYQTLNLDPHKNYKTDDIIASLGSGRVFEVPEAVKKFTSPPPTVMFTGTSNVSFASFVFTIQRWKLQHQCPTSNMTNVILSCLQGEAHTLLDTWRGMIEHVRLLDRLHYKEILRALGMQYWNEEAKDRARNFFLGLQQADTEPFSAFLNRFQSAMSGLQLSDADQRIPLSVGISQSNATLAGLAAILCSDDRNNNNEIMGKLLDMDRRKTTNTTRNQAINPPSAIINQIAAQTGPHQRQQAFTARSPTQKFKQDQRTNGGSNNHQMAPPNGRGPKGLITLPTWFKMQKVPTSNTGTRLNLEEFKEWIAKNVCGICKTTGHTSQRCPQLSKYLSDNPNGPPEATAPGKPSSKN